MFLYNNIGHNFTINFIINYLPNLILTIKSQVNYIKYLAFTLNF